MMSGSFEPPSIANLSVRDIVDAWAARNPDAVFLIDSEQDTILTFSDLKQQCAAFAANIALKGIGAGDRIAYAMGNGLDAARTILGILYGGYVATAVNLVSGKNTISHVLAHSAARLVFVQEQTASLVREAMAQNETPPEDIIIDNAWFQPKAPANGASAVPDHTHDSLLMYTSGTTGVPKGVVHSHRSLLAGGWNTVLAHHLTNRDRALCVLPLYHINGLCVTLIAPLITGGSVVIPPRFSVSTFWQLLRTYCCSWFSLVPTQISYLLHEAESNGHDPSGLEALRFGRSASAPLAPDIHHAFEARFNIKIIETMGLTETAAQILSNPIDGRCKIGSPGIPFGNEVRIADDKQIECPRGEEGEVIVRGANVMRCYRNNQEATAAALTKDGWLRTGDLGRMDEDGYVFITGRLKELIIKGGENIAPREVDEALYSHPDVIEAAAFARSCPRYGQRVEAGVSLRAGSSLTPDFLINLCHEKLGPFKSPDRIYFFDELPKGPSGKIQRLKLVEMTQEHGEGT